MSTYSDLKKSQKSDVTAQSNRDAIRKISNNVRLVEFERNTFDRLQKSNLGANSTKAIRDNVNAIHSKAFKDLTDSHYAVDRCLQDIDTLMLSGESKYVQIDKLTCEELQESIAAKKILLKNWKAALDRKIREVEYPQIQAHIDQTYGGSWIDYLDAEIQKQPQSGAGSAGGGGQLQGSRSAGGSNQQIREALPSQVTPQREPVPRVNVQSPSPPDQTGGRREAHDNRGESSSYHSSKTSSSYAKKDAKGNRKVEKTTSGLLKSMDGHSNQPQREHF